jgi:hypothetical protein
MTSRVAGSRGISRREEDRRCEVDDPVIQKLIVAMRAIAQEIYAEEYKFI